MVSKRIRKGSRLEGVLPDANAGGRIMKHDWSSLLDLAKRAADSAAAVHQQALVQVGFAVSVKSSAFDLVTEVDRNAERALVAVIRAARANDAILSEESGEIPGNTGVRWILDPLDGTTNFVHRYPGHAVAVGVEIEGRRTIGVVHDTLGNRVFSGALGQGATCDSKPISVRHQADLSKALVGTGFLPQAEVRRAQADLLRVVLPRVRDVRRSGCPSLDICAVASGSLDAFYECGLGPWDIAAAAAIAEAAGATVHLLHSEVLPDPLLVVANAQLVDALVAVLEEAGVAGSAPRTNQVGRYTKSKPGSAT